MSVLDVFFRNTKVKVNPRKNGLARIMEVYLDPQLNVGEIALSGTLCSHLHIKKGNELFVHNTENQKEIKAKVKKAPKELIEGRSKSESGFFITIGSDDIKELDLRKLAARKTDNFKDMYSEVCVRRK